MATGSSQTITFNPLPTVTYGVAPFALNATASSGLPVTYALSFGAYAPAVATLTNNVLTVTGASPGIVAGTATVTVTATQGGNATYSTSHGGVADL